MNIPHGTAFSLVLPAGFPAGGKLEPGDKLKLVAAGITVHVTVSLIEKNRITAPTSTALSSQEPT